MLMGLAVAGALAGSAGGAAAQYYEDYDYEYVPRYGYSYGYGQRYAPPAPVPLSQREIARIALREYGLAQVERTARTESTYVVDGQMANGRRTRLIFDLYSGDLVRRVNLQPPGPGTSVAPPVARLDPAEPRPAQPRLLPMPPERPPALKPPAQANAPVRVIPLSPATPPRPPEQEKPPAPPAEASAPATIVPPSPAVVPAAPEPAVPTERPPVEASVPATGEEKPRLVNPNDVRGTGEPERTPPLAKAETPPGAGGSGLPPVQVEDPAPSVTRPATPIAPVTPLD
ncbi:hypothetical protein DWF00_25685 [Bosea caraganae]|uniref:PepSY domain-containing protein n=1 Tax=Bosea caraganae TaxID=2763117 RepID=A0A370LA76_9HYPH|nr:hypothetical protein DWF00_25685 [Bosea caraganae]RDJ28225.1 hypothetical protein DWE98_06470 [Bosea caraganae]